MLTGQTRRSLRFLQKSLVRLLMSQRGWQEKLHRLKLPQIDMTNRNDNPHAALA